MRLDLAARVLKRIAEEGRLSLLPQLPPSISSLLHEDAEVIAAALERLPAPIRSGMAATLIETGEREGLMNDPTPAVLSEDRPAFGVEHRPAQAHLPVREERHVPPVLPAEPRGVHVERAELVAADVPAVDDGVGGQADDVERPLLARPSVRVLDSLADERLVERDVDVLLLSHFFSFPMLSFAAGAFRRPPSGRAGRGLHPDHPPRMSRAHAPLFTSERIRSTHIARYWSA